MLGMMSCIFLYCGPQHLVLMQIALLWLWSLVRKALASINVQL